MITLRPVIKKAFILLSIITLMGGSSLGVYAQTADGGSDSGSDSKQTEEEVKKNPKYVYDPVSGNWISDKYSWNPNTGETTELPKRGPVSTPGPDNQSPAALDASDETATGPSSNNELENNSTSSSQATVNNGLGVHNQIGANATTGNSTVYGNTAAGSALSGDASSIANIINMLQSSTVMGSQGMTTFQTDITGDVVGDMIINPELIFNLGPNSQNSSTNNVNGQSNLDINTNAAITNDVDLAANSGNATVGSNTQAGDATSGNAYVMANVVNVLNSVISANQSFLGLINIYGNLDGDILFPPETINRLLTSNLPTSNIEINNVTGNVTLNANNNLNTQNNINLNANSGTATVSGNTSAGNATTGEAKTNLTVLNLTGSEVIASNSILVFVNVMGTWVGMIMDAPNGATAAALGGGVTESNINADATVNANNNATIKNNLNLDATTGDAAVTNNSAAGNATTGNAYAAANVANINNSSLNLSNWFGLLFINVFGSWNGSFGKDTSAGTRQQVGGMGASGTAAAAPQVFEFVSNKPTNSSARQQYSVQPADTDTDKPVVLASTGTGTTTPTGTPQEELSEATKNNNRQVLLVSGAGLTLGMALLGAERVTSFMQNRRKKTVNFVAGGVAGTTKSV